MNHMIYITGCVGRTIALPKGRYGTRGNGAAIRITEGCPPVKVDGRDVFIKRALRDGDCQEADPPELAPAPRPTPSRTRHLDLEA